MKRAIVVALVLLSARSAEAERRRARIALADLPRLDVPAKIAAADAKLPDSAREGAAPPRAWQLGSDADEMQPFHCTDDRRASVTKMATHSAEMDTIWERDGKSFLDHAYVEAKDGRIHVREATRREVTRVVAGAWAYRANDVVIVLSASDSGRFDAKWAFFGCRIQEAVLPLAPGATTIASSPDMANDARIGILGSSYPRSAALGRPWKGVAYQMLATVSKSSADRGMMLSVVMIDR